MVYPFRNIRHIFYCCFSNINYHCKIFIPLPRDVLFRAEELLVNVVVVYSPHKITTFS